MKDYPEKGKPVIVSIHHEQSVWTDEGKIFIDEEKDYKTIGIWNGRNWMVAEYHEDYVWDRYYPDDEDRTITDWEDI